MGMQNRFTSGSISAGLEYRKPKYLKLWITCDFPHVNTCWSVMFDGILVQESSYFICVISLLQKQTILPYLLPKSQVTANTKLRY